MTLFRTIATFFAVAAGVLASTPNAVAQSSDGNWNIAKTASTATFSTAGQTITYTYVLTKEAAGLDSGIRNVTLVDSKLGAIACPPGELAKLNVDVAGVTATCTATYVTTAADLAAGSITNTATANGTISSDVVAIGPISITLTIGSGAAGQQARLQEIQRFLAHRLRLLLDAEPDRARFIRRVPDSVWDSSGAGSAPLPFAMTASASPLGGTMSFATGYRQIASVAAQAEARDTNSSGPLLRTKKLSPAPATTADLWMESHYTGFRSNIGGVASHGGYGVLYIGADYLATPDILLGALVQLDQLNDKTASPQPNQVKGLGAMAGPYASVRLKPDLFFDARAAWGVSRNDLNLLGAPPESFDTSRWLLHTKLTGNWSWGNFRMTPSAAIDYARDNARDYTSSLGLLIPSHSATLGRFSFGPEFGWRHATRSGLILEPMLSIIGRWDFEQPELIAANGATVRTGLLHAKLQGGLLALTESGWIGRFAATYEGFGSGLRGYGGQVWISAPMGSARLPASERPALKSDFRASYR